MKKTAIIADLHLDANAPQSTELFAHFFSHHCQNINTLYILGDLFEAWIGDDDHNAFIDQIKSLLKEFSHQGKQIFLMRGNRDFMLGQQFADDVGATLIDDPYPLILNGQALLLTHGDTLCTDDQKHQRYRRWIQHPLTKKLLLCLPLSLRRKIAQKLRAQSQQHFYNNNRQIQDVNQETVRKTFENQQCSVIIHGHTHLPGTHHYDQQRTRHVVGAWHHSGYALTLEDMEVHTWKLPSKQET